MPIEVGECLKIPHNICKGRIRLSEYQYLGWCKMFLNDRGRHLSLGWCGMLCSDYAKHLFLDRRICLPGL